eukprot:1989693-Pyramimonas_sp.AAC.1
MPLTRRPSLFFAPYLQLAARLANFMPSETYPHPHRSLASCSKVARRSLFCDRRNRNSSWDNCLSSVSRAATSSREAPNLSPRRSARRAKSDLLRADAEAGSCSKLAPGSGPVGAGVKTGAARSTT